MNPSEGNLVPVSVFLMAWLNPPRAVGLRLVSDDTPDHKISSQILDLWENLSLNLSEPIRMAALTPSIELPPSNDVIGWTKRKDFDSELLVKMNTIQSSHVFAEMCLNETSAYHPFGYVWVPAGHDVPCSSYCGQGNKEAFLFDGILNHAPIATKRCTTDGSSVPNGRWTWRNSHEHGGRCACKYGFYYTIRVEHSGHPKWMCRQEHSRRVRPGKRYIHCDP